MWTESKRIKKHKNTKYTIPGGGLVIGCGACVVWPGNGVRNGFGAGVGMPLGNGEGLT